ncbi:Bug family tripartite tricarboxylate transporter substrate binding protein [Parapusillimonas granuli]|uniref:Tripartite tricarboxylate transporter substrate binding protein n=1 Tax=Parapusillimonas granuli TaxID=380911 RepID=A0A853G444_9BURK|nr:tripartite tricarboxylate transporter substrate binding protein [Parapusillimonas granuli]MBB5215553.1 tripartite-type tricarboxylate transporter receptor subunit TctC [Parapusillimonas granuli]MEB2401092.1 tripartite tricarboxylate transporter substrate binding protein [Alcaligenaceae bacterium]NYT49780.1 tripartite tricarboxylate transporter substrate binding protein [Parapusillimonas granuli]
MITKWLETMTKHSALAALLLAGLALAPLSHAQPSGAAAGGYPERAVRIVVAYGPGGGADLIARAVAEKLTVAWGVPVIVDNRPGANGSIGASQVGNSSPDGYTLLMAYTPEIAINSVISPQKNFEPVRDLQPIIMAADSPLILVVNASSPHKTISSFIEYAKQNPGKVSYGTSGENSSGDLAGALLNKAAGISLIHIPYKGGNAAIVDLLGGQIDSAISGMPPALAHFQAKRLLPLAVTTRNRSPLLPNTPTLTELGVAVDISAWFGLFAPRGTPGPIVEKINRDVAAALASKDVKERLLSQGAEVRSDSVEEFTAFIGQEVEKYRGIIEQSKKGKGQ